MEKIVELNTFFSFDKKCLVWISCFYNHIIWVNFQAEVAEIQKGGRFYLLYYTLSNMKTKSYRASVRLAQSCAQSKSATV